MSRSSSRVVPLEDRVNILFATVVDSNGVEVATATVAQALSVSEADIDALRRPGAHRPDEHLLTALARYFDMPGNFLSDDPDEYHSPYRQLSLLIAQRDKRIPFVALRPSADHLGDDALQELTNYLESLGQ